MDILNYNKDGEILLAYHITKYDNEDLLHKHIHNNRKLYIWTFIREKYNLLFNDCIFILSSTSKIYMLKIAIYKLCSLFAILIIQYFMRLLMEVTLKYNDEIENDKRLTSTYVTYLKRINTRIRILIIFKLYSRKWDY